MAVSCALIADFRIPRKVLHIGGNATSAYEGFDWMNHVSCPHSKQFDRMLICLACIAGSG
jgi:hypothetical protein